VRTAFVIGTLATMATLPFAIVLGVLAGYFKGWVDEVIQYVYTTLTSVPNVLLIAACVLMVQVYLDTHAEMFETGSERSDLKIFLLCVILGLTGWATLCRLIRGETLKLRELDFVQAATAFGVSHAKIMARHIAPNVMHLVLITTVLSFSELILYEAVLTYVGVGVDPSMNSFGGMINLARSQMSATRWSGGASSRPSSSWSRSCSRPTCSPTACATRSIRAPAASGRAAPRGDELMATPDPRRRPSRLAGLEVALDADAGIVKAIDGLNLAITRGETFALVGESGCGKSMTALALMRLLPENGRIVGGRVGLEGQDLLALPEAGMRSVRGGRIGMIFQEPGTSLNPVMKVGAQIVEAIETHTELRGEAARAKAIEWLGRVGIPEPALRIDDYPFRPLRRAEAAGHDRHDARLGARFPDRRRADHLLST
jgi:ABC-type arginine transport system permease subunit